MVTLCAAAGSVVHYFTTGQGNVIGNPGSYTWTSSATNVASVSSSGLVTGIAAGERRLEVAL